MKKKREGARKKGGVMEEEREGEGEKENCDTLWLS